MKTLRNPELRRELLIYGLLTLAAFGLGFLISPGCAAALLGLGAVCTGLHFCFLQRRYRALEALSRSIDEVLHGQNALRIEGSTEGELAILQSEIRKMAVRLQEAAAQTQRDKLALSEGLADISHQLRTPLTAMNLTLSLLSREGIEEARRLALTRELKQSLARIDWLVETLLKLSKLDAGTVALASRQVTVRELIDAATEPLGIPMELRGQQLRVQCADERFTGDLAWSAEALGNLVKNCMEHTPEGGKIKIFSKENPIFTQIVVTDSGEGIDEEELPHIFERFYKAENASAQSVGIGLALAKQIINAHGGTVEAESEQGKGTTFTVRLYTQ
jgi:signal transduction histidine kinase